MQDRATAFTSFASLSSPSDNIWTQMFTSLAPGCNAVATYSHDDSDFSQFNNGLTAGAYYTVDSVDRPVFPSQVGGCTALRAGNGHRLDYLQ